VIGDWVDKLLAERGADRATFYRNLERGLAASRCHTCERLRQVGGCTVYTTCRGGDSGATKRYQEGRP
jgi:hypothetical protein